MENTRKEPVFANFARYSSSIENWKKRTITVEYDENRITFSRRRRF